MYAFFYKKNEIFLYIQNSSCIIHLYFNRINLFLVINVSTTWVSICCGIAILEIKHKYGIEILICFGGYFRNHLT